MPRGKDLSKKEIKILLRDKNLAPKKKKNPCQKIKTYKKRERVLLRDKNLAKKIKKFKVLLRAEDLVKKKVYVGKDKK